MMFWIVLMMSGTNAIGDVAMMMYTQSDAVSGATLNITPSRLTRII